MGRKKKKASKQKSWCWYCNREFDDDKILVQHQKAKHFKCHICHKKLYTGPGLSIHCMQVHKEAIDKVPNSLPNRSNIEIEIYGMEGIPAEDVREHERQKNGNKSESEDDEPVSKKQKTEPMGQGMAGGMQMGGGVAAAAAAGGPAGMMMQMMQQFGGMPPMMMPGFMPGGMPMMSMSGPPPRPLFPAAATSMPNASMMQQQAKPTFPAYSNATISAPPTTNSAPASNASSKIMHPADDLSLEELRARKPKYNRKGVVSSSLQQSSSSSNAVTRSAPPSSSPIAASSLQQQQQQQYNSSSAASIAASMAAAGHSMTGAAVAQAAMMAHQQQQQQQAAAQQQLHHQQQQQQQQQQLQIPTSLADQQNAAIFAAHTAMAQNQKNLDDLNRAVMMQRFQQAAAAGARPGGPPGMGMMQLQFPPQMMRPMFNPQAAALLQQNMMRHGPPPGMGMPPAGILAIPTGMGGPPMGGMLMPGHPGIMGMMPPRFR